MNEACTIRNSGFGENQLRLMRLDQRVFGLANGEIKIVGQDPDDVWQRLRNEVDVLDKNE